MQKNWQVIYEMRNIIADTSCLIVLEKINMLYLLKELYGTILVTEEVAGEYGDEVAEWIKIRQVQDRKTLEVISAFVDLGEASSIALAMETENSTIIIDDLKGRKVAEKLGLRITGTIGVLLKAKDSNLVDSLKSATEQLKASGFRISNELEQEILRYD